VVTGAKKCIQVSSMYVIGLFLKMRWGPGEVGVQEKWTLLEPFGHEYQLSHFLDEVLMAYIAL
jgi:hypothetical protein